MSNLLNDLSNRYFSRYPFVKGVLADLTREVGLRLEIDYEDGDVKNQISFASSNRSKICCLLLLLLSFIESDKNLRKKLLSYIRNFMHESKLMHPSISEYTKFICCSFSDLISFVMESMIEDINIYFSCSGLYSDNSEAIQSFIEKYTCSVQYILNDVFEILFSSTGTNSKENMRSDYVLPLLFEGICNLDLTFKKLLINLIHVQTPEFVNKAIFHKSDLKEKIIDFYFEIDQHLMLCITSILNRILSIVICCSNSFSSLIKYLKVLFNTDVLDEIEGQKATKKVINLIFNRILCSIGLDQFNKDLITSIGIFTSLLYISEQTTYYENEINYLHLNMIKIVKNSQEHVERFKFSNVCQMAFYRGLTLCCSMISDINRLINQMHNYEIFKASFQTLEHLICDLNSEEDSAYGLQSLIVWISRFKYEISSLNKDLISISVPCFYLIPISDIILSFFDQPIVYYSKLANQILEEFVDYLLILDSIFEHGFIEEINSDPISWFMSLLFSNSLNNNKHKFLSLNALFNGILNHSNSYNLKNMSYKLNRIINLSLNQLEFTELDNNFIEIQFVYYLVYSLSINNLSSSSQNLILTWFNLRRKILLEGKIANELEVSLFLDFILIASIQIIKRDNIKYNLENIEIIVSEAKSNMFTRLLQILKKADRKYHFEKLPFIFDSFFEDKLKEDFLYWGEFDFIQIQILVELKRNGCLFWENLELKCDPVNNLALLVVFNKSEKNPYCKINGNYLIKSLTSNNSISLAHILDLLSLSIKPSELKNSCESNWLFNEMECLFIIICNIKPLSICSGVLSRIISTFEKYFVLIKKKLLKKDNSPIFKDKIRLWLNKTFNYLRTSIGIQTSSNKVDIYLPIFRNFLETFCLEYLYENSTECKIVLNERIINSLILNLYSQLFSSSNECKNLVSDLMIKNQNFNSMFYQFHSKLIETENLHLFNHTLLIIKKLFNNIRPREYFVSNTLFYYFLKKMCTNSKNNKEKSEILLRTFFELLSNEINEKINNIYFPINEVIFSEVITRINSFCSNNFDFDVLIFGNNNVPLQSMLNLIGKSFITEFKNDSATEYEFFCGNSLQIFYLFTLLLFTLSDYEITNFQGKFRSELDKVSCSEQSYVEYLNHNRSKIIDEVCNILKIILFKIGIDSIFEVAHSQLKLIPCDLNIQDLYFNSFLNRLNAAFMSKKGYHFIYRLCLIYINLIFKCEHPGNSENLLEIFSSILNSINSNQLENSVEKKSKTRSYRLPLIKTSMLFNNETIQVFNNYISTNPHSILNKSKIKNSAQNKSFLSKEQADELPENLLLHIVYSLLQFDKPNSELNKDQFSCQIVGKFTFDYEKVDDVFFQFIFGNTNYTSVNNKLFTTNFPKAINELFSLNDNSTINLEKLNLPHPKRKSNNLCKIISILVSILIKDSKFHKSVKYVIKLLIIASLNINIFHGIKDLHEYSSDDILQQRLSSSIHSNHILAVLISKSKSGNGENNLCEVFDLSLLCGSLFSALNNVKMYDFKVKDESGFTLCNSSLNLMSALLKRFSFKANGIESNIEYNNRSSSKFKLSKSEFKISGVSNELFPLFNNVFKDALSYTLKKQINSNILNSFINQINVSTSFSFKSIKRISGIFETCIIDILFNSDNSQFQGMILLLLSEMSITWLDCSRELSICIIKLIYSNSYFVRIHSSKLLGKVISRTLNIPNFNLCSIDEISNSSLNGALLKIFIENSTNQHSKLISLLNLIFHSMKFSFHHSDANKFNLIHGVLNLGIELLKQFKSHSFLSNLENENCSIYEGLLALACDGFKNLFKCSTLRISSLELISLLLELEFPINEKLKCLENLINNWTSDFSIFISSYLETNNLKDQPFKCTNFQKRSFCKNPLEPIYLVKIIVRHAIKYDSKKLDTLICLSPTIDKVIHPKILFEFYSSIIEILSNSPETNDSTLVQIFFSSINNDLKSIRHLVLTNNKVLTVDEEARYRKTSILMDLFKTLIGCLSFIGFNKNLSFALLHNEHFNSILESIFDLINHQEFLEFKFGESKNNNLESKTDLNKKINNFFLKNQIPMLEITIFFVRFYKIILKLNENKKIFQFKLEELIFDKILKMVYNINDENQTTFEKKYLICKIMKTIFESLESEIFTYTMVSKNERNQELVNSKKDINKIDKYSVLSLLSLNHSYWYNLMVCLIYLMTDEVMVIENKAIATFNSFCHIIKYFCKKFLRKSKISLDYNLNYIGNCENSIEQIILLNDQNSCLFSIIILDVISSSLGKVEAQNDSVFFPREIDNICNEYLRISQIATSQIFRYIETINQIKPCPDEISKIEQYFEYWASQANNEPNLFEKVNNCLRNCPNQLICIELFGNILIDDIKILFFVISVRKLIIISKYNKINNKEGKFETSNINISLFEEYFDFLLSNVDEKKYFLSCERFCGGIGN